MGKREMNMKVDGAYTEKYLAIWHHSKKNF